MRIEKRLPGPSGTKSAMAWYGKPTEALAGELQTDLSVGLNVEEATHRQAQEGPNELPDAPPPSLLKLFLSQFSSLIVGADRGGHRVGR